MHKYKSKTLCQGWKTANFLTEDSYLDDILKPLTLNRYNYCAGNPVNFKDPSGNVILESLLIGIGVGAVVGAVGGAVHGALTSATDAIRGTGEAKDKKIETFWDGAKYVAEKTIESAALGAIGGTVFQYTLGAMQHLMLTEAAKYVVSGAASGWATAQTDAVIHNRSLDTSDAIFSAVLGGSMAYAGYKTAEAVTRNNARTIVEETNAKIKANEDPVKENSGNTASKNSNQNNNGGSKNSGKNNANTKNNSTAKNNNATKNNSKSSQTPLEENANAAKNCAETDTCPLSKDGNNFEPSKIFVDKQGNLTNGRYTINDGDMLPHKNGTVGKSQFLSGVDAGKAVLDAAEYADNYNLWETNTGNPNDFACKAKVYVENGPVGITGDDKPTNYINVYRTKTGQLHGCPGN